MTAGGGALRTSLVWGTVSVAASRSRSAAGGAGRSHTSPVLLVSSSPPAWWWWASLRSSALWAGSAAAGGTWWSGEAVGISAGGARGQVPHLTGATGGVVPDGMVVGGIPQIGGALCGVCGRRGLLVVGRGRGDPGGLGEGHRVATRAANHLVAAVGADFHQVAGRLVAGAAPGRADVGHQPRRGFAALCPTGLAGAGHDHPNGAAGLGRVEVTDELGEDSIGIGASGKLLGDAGDEGAAGWRRGARVGAVPEPQR